MVTRVELLSMTPKEVFLQAQRDGLHNARILQSLGLKPDAVRRWHKARPQYGGLEVKSLMNQGDEQASRETFQRVRQLPNRSGILVLNHTGKAVGVFRFPPKQ